MKIPPTGDSGQIAIALLDAQQMVLINPDLGGIGAWDRSQRNKSRRQVS